MTGESPWDRPIICRTACDFGKPLQPSSAAAVIDGAAAGTQRKMKEKQKDSGVTEFVTDRNPFFAGISHIRRIVFAKSVL